MTSITTRSNLGAVAARRLARQPRGLRAVARAGHFEAEPPQRLLRNDGVDVVVLGQQRARNPGWRRRPRRLARGCDGGEFARQPLEQRASAHRLDQPAVESAQGILPEGAPLERREQDEALGRARHPRRARELVGRLHAERAIDDYEIRRRAGLQRRQPVVEPFGAANFGAGVAEQGRERRRLERRIGDDQRPPPLEIDGPRLGSVAAEGEDATRIGMANEKIEPPAGLSFSVSSPPINATSRLEMASPRPVPSK